MPKACAGIPKGICRDNTGQQLKPWTHPVSALSLLLHKSMADVAAPWHVAVAGIRVSAN